MREEMRGVGRFSTVGLTVDRGCEAATPEEPQWTFTIKEQIKGLSIMCDQIEGRVERLAGGANMCESTEKKLTASHFMAETYEDLDILYNRLARIRNTLERVI